MTVGNYIPKKGIIGSLSKKKTNKLYYENSSERKVSDNKPFWKIVKSLLYEKFHARQRLTLSENSETVKTEKGAAGVFNNLFDNIVKNPIISRYSDFDPSTLSIKCQRLKPWKLFLNTKRSVR